MNNVHLLLSLGVGTIFAFLLFFGLYLGLKWEGKKAAFTTILTMWLIYFPLAYLHWPGIDVFAIHFVFYTMTGYGLGIVTNVRSTRMRMEGADTQGGWFHWAPALIVFFFLLLTLQESNLITKALSHKPGIVAHDFRQKEGQYNAHLRQLKIQDERGWKITGGWKQAPLINVTNPFVIKAHDKAGNAISQAKVKATFLSTVNTDKDMDIDLKESEAGVYSADVTLPLYGEWTILVTVKKGDDLHEIKGQIEVDPEKK